MLDIKKEIIKRILEDECPFCRKLLWIGNDTGIWRCIHCNKSKDEINKMRDVIRRLV